VVGVALIPAVGPLSALRALRLVSAVPSMKRVVSGPLAAVAGMASVASLLALVSFVAAVMATTLFGAITPVYFGDLGTTFFTLHRRGGAAWRARWRATSRKRRHRPGRTR
jgi:voltage-gated sodium channel